MATAAHTPNKSTVYFARPDALKGSLPITLKAVRPTAFFGVPRVWEKFEEKMKEVRLSAKQSATLLRAVSSMLSMC